MKPLPCQLFASLLAWLARFWKDKRLEIHNLRGVMVFSNPVSGHDVTLPLDFLRPGTYIVSIHTHNGTTHKRLVVAR